MTTSQRSNAASPPRPVASTGPATESSAWSSARGASSTSTGSMLSARHLRRFASPSRPSPYRPTRRPRKSDQERFGRITPRDVVGAHRLQERVDGRLEAPGGQLAGQRAEGRVAGSVRPLGGQPGGSPAFGGVADAFPRLGGSGQPG